MKTKFSIGDEVFDVKAPETRAVVTRCTNDDLYVVFCDGSCGKENINLFKKTGRRFYEIENIIKELG